MSSGDLGLPLCPSSLLGRYRGSRIPDVVSGTEALSSRVLLALQLNLSRPIEEQGPLDVIIHKLTDVILEADQNDSQSLELVHRFQVSKGGDPACGACGGGGGRPG